MCNNTMANFSISSLILCLITFSSVKPITSQQNINTLCSKAMDRNFCRQVLSSSSSQSLDALLKTAVSQAATFSSATRGKIQNLLAQPNDPNLIVAYFQCSNYYSAAEAALGAASQLLDSRAAADVVGDVRSAANTARKDGDSCEASFKNGVKSTLSQDNRSLKLYSNVVSVVCDAL